MTNEELDELERLYSREMWDPTLVAKSCEKHGHNEHSLCYCVRTQSGEKVTLSPELAAASYNALPDLIAAARERQTCAVWCGNVDDMRHLERHLLAARRALKMAQAKALDAWGWVLYHAPYAPPDAFPVMFRRGKKHRAMRLMTHWRKKFEREAKEMGK